MVPNGVTLPEAGLKTHTNVVLVLATLSSVKKHTRAAGEMTETETSISVQKIMDMIKFHVKKLALNSHTLHFNITVGVAVITITVQIKMDLILKSMTKSVTMVTLQKALEWEVDGQMPSTTTSLT